ncbi:MAG: homing endonuclease [Parcubacteria group bacterium Gr01-1014_29]|nr:MAG: homing endonuclease [Parcubacteria group bacterium Gr01-1014_29]
MGTKVIPREASRVTNSTTIRNLRDSLVLNDLQHKVLIGAILGDGSLIANSWGKSYRFHTQQSNVQKDYVFWKYKIFKNFVLSPPRFEAVTNSWKFRTISHPEFTAYRNIFYSGKKKIIPSNIDELLTHPISMAVWYMDDGCYVKRDSTFILNTQSFSWPENYILQECLRKKFSIETTIQRDKSYWRLYVKKRSAEIFRKLIWFYRDASMRKRL